MKFCKKCQTHQPEENFYKSIPRYCKTCMDAYTKKWQSENRARKSEHCRNWRAAHKIRLKTIKDAGNAVYQAVLKGKIVRPTICEKCGKQPDPAKKYPIEAAHLDYSEPFKVMWLCVSCHRRWDRSQPKSSDKNQQILSTTLA